MPFPATDPAYYLNRSALSISFFTLWIFSARPSLFPSRPSGSPSFYQNLKHLSSSFFKFFTAHSPQKTLTLAAKPIFLPDPHSPVNPFFLNDHKSFNSMLTLLSLAHSQEERLYQNHPLLSNLFIGLFSLPLHLTLKTSTIDSSVTR